MTENNDPKPVDAAPGIDDAWPPSMPTMSLTAGAEPPKNTSIQEPAALEHKYDSGE